jgi:acetyl esterase
MLAADAQFALNATAAADAPAIETLQPEVAKRLFLESCPRLQGPKEPVAEIRAVSAPASAGQIPLRLYRGHGCPAADARCLVYFHGGGWMLGNLDSHDNICRWIANIAEGLVISVDYGLTPDRPFPAAIEDGAAALRHILSQAAAWGIDSSRIAVGGDSAGGNIAAVMALLARDGTVPPLSFQILLYPVTDVSTTQNSYKLYAEGYGLTTAAMRWFRQHYLGMTGDGTDWRISPLHAQHLSGLAPAFILTAGYDPLHDEAKDYAIKLAQAHVPVRLDENPSQIHGFLSMDRFIAEARPSIERAVRAWLATETAAT